MILQDAVVVRNADLVSAPMGNEVVLMDMSAGTYFVLDEVGATIWDRLETPTSVGALCRQLGTLYDVSEDRCAADVARFLETMRDRRLLRVVDDPVDEIVDDA